MALSDDLAAVEQKIEQCIAYEQQTFGASLGDLFAQAVALRSQLSAQQGYSPPPGTPGIGQPEPGLTGP